MSSTNATDDPETIYVAMGTGHNKTRYHTDPECTRLARAEDVKPRPFAARPLRSKHCSYCEGDK